jgi:peptidoglycan pentaglycine glycine transferase (the first glycine)
VATKTSETTWESTLAQHPDAHLLQSAPWGALKAAYGWDVETVQDAGCGAQVLFRRFPLGLKLAYIPKGPVGDWLPSLLPQLDALCRRKGAFALKVEADAPDDDSLARELRASGFIPSHHTVQPRRTIIVDLQGTEDEILARMNQKTRYNVRLATRKGVVVRPWDDLDAFGSMMQETAARDRFGVHVPAYYRMAYDLFHPRSACEIFVAAYEGIPLASIMVFAHGSRAWYFYGASTAHHRNRMPTYLLQWEGMRWARARGCTHYDLWGVPDEDLETLEAQFTERGDGLWGVYRFKRGFGGQLVRSIGAWDRPYIAPMYWLYRRLTSRGNR